MNKIKTTTRKVKQSVRKFTDEQRKEIIRQIDNRPSTVSKSEMFEKFGLGHGGNLYYTWKEKFGLKAIKTSENVPTTRPMNVKSTKTMNGHKSFHIVTLKVEVGSLMDLIGFCNDIVKTPKVKSVLSVE